MIKKILSTASAIALLVGLIGGAITYDASLAKEKDVAVYVSAVEAKLDLYLIDQELADIRKQLFEIRNRWAPIYKEENGEPYKTIDHLLDFIKVKDKYDYDRYNELSDRKKELEEKKKKVKERLNNV